MIKCQEVPEVLNGGTWSLKLQLHLLICPPCRALQRQWSLLDERLKKMLAQASPPRSELIQEITEKYLK